MQLRLYLKLLFSSVKLNKLPYMTQSFKTQLLKNIPPMHSDKDIRCSRTS